MGGSKQGQPPPFACANLWIRGFRGSQNLPRPDSADFVDCAKSTTVTQFRLWMCARIKNSKLENQAVITHEDICFRQHIVALVHVHDMYACMSHHMLPLIGPSVVQAGHPLVWWWWRDHPCAGCRGRVVVPPVWGTRTDTEICTIPKCVLTQRPEIPGPGPSHAPTIKRDGRGYARTAIGKEISKRVSYGLRGCGHRRDVVLPPTS